MRRDAHALNADGAPRPFATPPEAHVLGSWTAPVPPTAGHTPSWAAEGVCAGARRAGDGHV